MELLHFSCAICEKSFKNCIQLEIHVIGVHVEGKFQCKFCNQILESLRSQEEHEKIHENLKKNVGHVEEKSCEVTKIAQNDSDFKGKYQKSNFEIFKCHVNLTRLNSDELSKHVDFLAGISNNKRTSSRLHLRLNLKGQFQCKVCEKIYKTSNSLSAHMKIHVKASDRVWECPGCTKMFKNPSNLNEHKIICIFAKEKFYCKCCRIHLMDSDFTHRKLHIKKKPNSAYYCDYCGDTYYAAAKQMKYHVVKCSLKNK